MCHDGKANRQLSLILLFRSGHEGGALIMGNSAPKELKIVTVGLEGAGMIQKKHF